jgi:hypothetical protein
VTQDVGPEFKPQYLQKINKHKGGKSLEQVKGRHVLEDSSLSCPSHTGSHSAHPNLNLSTSLFVTTMAYQSAKQVQFLE